jgi:hypothetical protein
MASHKLTSQSTYSLPHSGAFPFGPSIQCSQLLIVLVGDAVVGGSGALLLELLANRLAMELLFEYGLRLNHLELGLEVFHVVGGGVAATACVDHIGLDVFEFIAGSAPVALAATI